MSEVEPKILLPFQRYSHLLEMERTVRTYKQAEMDVAATGGSHKSETENPQTEKEEEGEEEARRRQKTERDVSDAYGGEISSGSASSSLKGQPFRVSDVKFVFENLSKRLHNMAARLLENMEQKGDDFTLDNDHVLYYHNDKLGRIKALVHGYLMSPDRFQEEHGRVYDLFKMLLPRRIHHRKPAEPLLPKSRKKSMQQEEYWYKLPPSS